MDGKRALTTEKPRGTRGFSVVELLIVAVVMTVLVGYSLVRITEARHSIARSNAALEFTNYVEKARRDSIRRHPDSLAETARVVITNSKSYSVSLDANSDGTIDAPRVVNLPADSKLVFNRPFPRTIMFDWRGRTVDLENKLTKPALVTIGNAHGTTRIYLDTSGRSSIDRAPLSN